jgi:hypothetical protein
MRDGDGRAMILAMLIVTAPLWVPLLLIWMGVR